MILLYTATIADTMRPQTAQSIEAQSAKTPFVWEVGRHNPYPGQKMRNVVAQMQRARAMALAGGYEGLLTVEHDMILPAGAIDRLYATDAPVVYGLYVLRHGTPVLNAWRYNGRKSLGMTLSLYPLELARARRRGWAEVCGVGWGCTLIRREVLAAMEVESRDESDAGDLTFARNCLARGIRQIARFDVACGHIRPDGRILYPFQKEGIVSRVYTLTDLVVNVEGQSVPLKAKHYYTLPPDVADELVRAGFVEIQNKTVAEGEQIPEDATLVAQSGEEDMETADAPDAPESADAPKAKKPKKSA